jgi:molybdate transport system regulatory protein
LTCTRTQARLTFVVGSKQDGGQLCYGIVQLLRGIEQFGSLIRAARAMGMAYSKAWTLLQECEAAFGFALIDRHGTHGSTLSPEGAKLLEAYSTLAAEIDEFFARRTAELVG